MRVKLWAYDNRTYKFDVLVPTSTWFLKRAAGIEKGTSRPSHDFVGSVTLGQLYRIAEVKQMDENMAKLPLKSVVKSLMGSCGSLGLHVLDDDLGGGAEAGEE